MRDLGSPLAGLRSDLPRRGDGGGGHDVAGRAPSLLLDFQTNTYLARPAAVLGLSPALLLDFAGDTYEVM